MPVGGNSARIVFWAAVLLGVSYLFGIYWADSIPDEETTEAMMPAFTAWKGAGVWLLAIYAALNAKSTDGWLIAAVMAFGALGDVLIEQDLTMGGAAFAVGHGVAIWLYLRNRRKVLMQSQIALAFVVVPSTIAIAALMTRDFGIIVYSAILAAMGALAWTSRFPRYRVGIGALMFVASDLLIFARIGPLSEDFWVDYLVWGLYFVGQMLIVLGVTRTLAGAESGRKA
jgi:uncharacterized membrane protein YhhN